MDALQRREGLVLVELGPAVAVQQLALAVLVVVRVAVVGPATRASSVGVSTQMATAWPCSHVATTP